MKKAVLLLFFLTLTLSAQSYHTVTIDGNNDFSTSAERFSTTSGTTLYSYVTFDKDYLYFAFSGSSVNGTVTDNSRNFHIYLDTDPKQTPTQGTGTTAGESWNYTPTLPFSANYHYVFKTSNNAEYKRGFSGSAWGDVSFSTFNWKNTGGYWEIRIKLSDLGNPSSLNLVAYVEEDWSTGSICGGIPSGLFTNRGTPGAITFNSKWLNLPLLDQITPTSVFNLNNYSWTIRLKASTGSLTDTTAYAGMATNASDGFDTGIDLPKPPSTPTNFIEVYFPHTDWASALGPKFMRDFKLIKGLDSTTSSWDFTVNTDQTNASVTITPDQFSAIQSTYNIKLYDVTRDSSHNVRTQGAYTYNSGVSGGTRLFKLIIGVTLSAPNISVSPTSINYGTVKTNRDSTVNLTVSNTGDSAVVISNIVSSNSVFTFTGGTAYTIPRNGSITIPVKFIPVSSAVYNGTLTITSNDPDTPNLVVNLTGTGQSLSPNLSLSATTIAYGTVLAGTDSLRTFKIKNTGDTTATISGISSTSTAFSSTTTTPFTIAVNDSATVTVKFSPVAAVGYSGTLKVVHNQAGLDTLRVTLTGTGYVRQPNIAVSSTTVAFGNAAVGSSVSSSVKVYNTGDAALTVTAANSSSSSFSRVTAVPFTLNPGDSTVLSLKFSPKSKGSLSGTVKIISNDPDTISVAVSGSGTSQFIANAFTSGWNLISVPVAPDTASPQSVFGDDLTNYFLYRYVNSTYGAVDTVRLGTGYWLGLEAAGTVDVGGIPSVSTQAYSLNRGFNLIGAPFFGSIKKSTATVKRGSTTVSADSAVSLGWFQNTYYGYKAADSAYKTKDTLSSWNGYWLMALTDSLTLTYNYDSSLTTGTARMTIPDEIYVDANNWYVNINASLTSGSKDNLLSFGTASNATTGFDARYDMAKPPVSPVANRVETWFDYPNWTGGVVSKFASDIRQPLVVGNNYSWSFNVRSTSQEMVKLNWQDILSTVPQSVRNAYKFELTGISGTVNMLTVQSTQFTAAANQTYTFIINASPTGIDNNGTVPSEFALNQNYPNPFNPSTVISYALPVSGQVSLVVYDVLGNAVTTLINGYKNAGTYSVSFDASHLPSGVYLYTLNAGSFKQTRKLVLMR